MNVAMRGKYLALIDYANYVGACGGYFLLSGDNKAKMLSEIKEFIIHWVLTTDPIAGQNDLYEDEELFVEEYNEIFQSEETPSITEVESLSINNSDIKYKIILIGEGPNIYGDVIDYMIDDINSEENYEGIQNDWLWGSDEEKRKGWSDYFLNLKSRLSGGEELFPEDLDQHIPYIS